MAGKREVAPGISVPSEYADLVDTALKQGFQIRRTGHSTLVTTPNGKDAVSVTTSDPSDWRAKRNIEAQFKRLGVKFDTNGQGTKAPEQPKDQTVRVLEVLQQHTDPVDDSMLAAELPGISKTQLLMYLNRLVDRGVVMRVGRMPEKYVMNSHVEQITERPKSEQPRGSKRGNINIRNLRPTGAAAEFWEQLQRVRHPGEPWTAAEVAKEMGYPFLTSTDKTFIHNRLHSLQTAGNRVRKAAYHTIPGVKGRVAVYEITPPDERTGVWYQGSPKTAKQPTPPVDPAPPAAIVPPTEPQQETPAAAEHTAEDEQRLKMEMEYLRPDEAGQLRKNQQVAAEIARMNREVAAWRERTTPDPKQRYLELLLQIAEKDPNPTVLDRIEKLL